MGTATLSFGFKFAGASVSAGVVTTAFAFGLVLLALVYTIGPISGCHVNPAVTIGFVVSKRMALSDAIGYWIAQFAGGIVGAIILWAIFQGAPSYSRKTTGLGADGWGKQSMIGLNGGGAFAAEVVLTFLFVLVVLSATSYVASANFAGLAIGMALTAVHLFGIPLTGTSVNPARSLGPAIDRRRRRAQPGLAVHRCTAARRRNRCGGAPVRPLRACRRGRARRGRRRALRRHRLVARLA